jgi:hypothetical protein
MNAPDRDLRQQMRLVAEYSGWGRLQRWLYLGLHRWDVPGLAERPRLRRALLLAGCGSGLLLAVTGARLALGRPRRRRRSLRRATRLQRVNPAVAITSNAGVRGLGG